MNRKSIKRYTKRKHAIDSHRKVSNIKNFRCFGNDSVELREWLNVFVHKSQDPFNFIDFSIIFYSTRNVNRKANEKLFSPRKKS